MKKTIAGITSAISALAITVPAYAQNIGLTKPNEARITDIGKLINSSINLVIIVAGILVFVYLVWGGIQWLTSGGDKGKVEEARNMITHALIGLAIIAAAWALSQVITTFFGVNTGLGNNFDITGIKPYN